MLVHLPDRKVQLVRSSQINKRSLGFASGYGRPGHNCGLLLDSQTDQGGDLKKKSFQNG
jgi:hypothetical protein